MNDLIIPSETLENLPNIKEGILKAKQLFDEVKSFEDLERTFLRGEGLSAGTYRVYLQSVKSFYQFTEGGHPFQVRPADIEAWYDSMRERLDLATCYNRIMGLKRFFAGIEKQVPFFLSPFNKMSEKLKSKLYAAKKGRKKVKALTIQEVKRIIREYPAVSVREKEDLAIFYFLVTSGLRAFELLQLRWGDIEEYDGTLFAGFTQKGGEIVQQELYGPAVESAREYFKAQFKKSPSREDRLFWTVPAFACHKPEPMGYHVLLFRMKKFGEQLQTLGIIKRKIDWTVHITRRSYATILYRSGMKVKALQEKTRHKSRDILIDHYISDSESAQPYFAKIFAGMS